uniref:ribonuclease H n=1 Tax=Amphiprion ocellaris TaxID=80972 RepID=A0A3Q1BYW9_AMPOC
MVKAAHDKDSPTKPILINGKVFNCLCDTGALKSASGHVTPLRTTHPATILDPDSNNSAKISILVDSSCPFALSLEHMQLLGTLPSALWSTSPTDVGLIKDQDPIKVKLVKSDRPKLKQYPLTQETQEGIGPVIKDMLKAGILRKTDTPICKTPIFPVKKANGKWRMVQDLRAVNAIVEPEPVEVANPHTLLNSIGSRDKWFSVVDLSNALFSVPLDRESQDLFAFQYNGQMYTYTRLPQGFTNSPTLYSQALRASMTRCSPLINGQYLLYVDDILITGHTKQDCERNTLTVLQHLYAEGHKVSKTRIQLCQPEVVYLGIHVRCTYPTFWCETPTFSFLF